MKRIIAILMLATTAHAQVWLGYTNEISGVTGPLLYTNFIAGQFRVTVAATDGGTPIDLSVDRVSLQVQDTRDNKLVVSNTCVTIDAYNYRGEGGLSASPAPYTLRVQVYPAANPDAYYPIYWASLTITSAPSASGGGSVSVSVTTTANLTVASSGTGNVVTGLTANGSVVTEHRGTVAGGSGSALTISGTATSTAVSEIRFGNNLTVTDQGGGTTRVDYLSQTYPAWAIRTNVASYSSVGTQLVTFAEGITNARFDGWSGAGYHVGTGAGKSMGSHGRLLLRGNLWGISIYDVGAAGWAASCTVSGYVHNRSNPPVRFRLFLAAVLVLYIETQITLSQAQEVRVVRLFCTALKIR
jgi:hypothetical protein